MQNNVYDFIKDNYLILASICILSIILVLIVLRRRGKIHKGKLLLIGVNHWFTVAGIGLYCLIMSFTLAFREWSLVDVCFVLILGLFILIAQMVFDSNYIFKLTLRELIVSSMIMSKKVIPYSSINCIYLQKNALNVRCKSNELFSLKVSLNTSEKSRIIDFLKDHNVCVEDENQNDSI